MNKFNILENGLVINKISKTYGINDSDIKGKHSCSAHANYTPTRPTYASPNPPTP